MKAWKKIALGISGLTLMSATLFTVSMAWYQSLNKASISNDQGYTASAYFAGGDGSSTNPYIINQPIHLYNLAWLQYLGFFNKNSNGAYKQTYFVLGADVDMSSTTINWTLPPIGTTDNPFIGNFDGKGYTISNLVVDNTLGDGHITRTPTIVTSITGVNIVGTFGVVGPYNLDSTITYSSTVNAVKNVKLSAVNVKSSLSSTLIGIGAGYVNAAITDMGILNSKVTVASGSSAISGGPTTAISDYTTVGYCTDAYKSLRDKRNTDVKAAVTGTAYFSSLNSGANAGWGGSIAMSDMFDRLKGYVKDTSAHSSVLDTSAIVTSETVNVAVNGTTTTTTTGTLGTAGKIKNYYDGTSKDTRLKGSYSFDYLAADDSNGNVQDIAYSDSRYANYQFILLYGKQSWTKTRTTLTHTIGSGSGYRISYGSGSSANYLVLNSTGVTTTNTKNSGTIFTIPNDGTTGTISTVINNTIYYLNPYYTLDTNYYSSRYYFTYVSDYGLQSGTSSTYLWTRSGKSFYIPITTTEYYYGSNYDTNHNYYLNYNNGWTLTTSKLTLTLSSASGTVDKTTTTNTKKSS
jgi:hypothetical protein